MLDLKIVNGTVVTGLSDAAVQVDIGVRDEMIVMLKSNIGEPAKYTIDASGLVVTPGFIDIHAHDDLEILVNPEARPKVMQGITTQLNGHCGIGPAPLSQINEELWQNLLYTILGHHVEEWSWSSFSEYMFVLSQGKCAINNMFLIGHGAVRMAVTGMANRLPTSAELGQMTAIVEEAMQAGAAGLSAGLIYLPSVYSDENEIAALARIVARHGGIFVPHGRSTGVNVVMSLLELIRVAESSGVRLHIPHNKITGEKNWAKQVQIFEMIESARRSGLKVTYDLHTYNGASTTLLAMLPPWAVAGGFDALKTALGNRESRASIKEIILQGTSADSAGWEFTTDLITNWDNVVLTSVQTEKNKPIEGKSFAEIIDLYNADPYDIALDLLMEENGMVGFSVDGAYSDEQVEFFLQDPNCAIGSDGLPGEHPDPRLYGTFPRLLGRFVRDKNAISLTDAVKRMSVLPAEILHLERRGRLEEGCYADITIFDFDTINDAGSYRNPKQFPLGIKHVIVNGSPVVENGEHTGCLPGKTIKYSC